MTALPAPILQIFSKFAPLFSFSVHKNALELLTEHFLCTGKRTVTNLIRILGKQRASNFTVYHYVLRKAKWSPFQASKILFSLLVDRLLPKDAPIVVNIDSHLNKRRGPKIKGLGYHRDAVASSKSQKVFSTGHNWLVAGVSVRIFGSKFNWTLPFLSYLLTPEKPLSSSLNMADLKRKVRHKKMTKIASQFVILIRRWMPARQIIVVADSAFCCRDLCRTCNKYKVVFITQLRLDASLFDLPPSHNGKRGRPRIVGDRLPTLGALLTDRNQRWVPLEVPWYNGGTKFLDVLTDTCLWYHSSVGGVI